MKDLIALGALQLYCMHFLSAPLKWSALKLKPFLKMLNNSLCNVNVVLLSDLKIAVYHFVVFEIFPLFYSF